MMRAIDFLTQEELDFVLEHPSILIEAYFKDEVSGQPIKITPTQEEIVKHILLKYPKRILIWAATRWGKSLSVALGALLVAHLMPGEKIRIIAPTTDLSNVIMRYIATHITDSEEIVKNVEMNEKITVARVKKELSKRRITFSNHSEISIHSANISGEGRSLLARGGSIIIVDEAESIPAEIIRSRIMRMAGEREDSQIILISNPTYRGFMYEKRSDPDWLKIKIDWKTAVKEGRLSKEFIEEQRRNLTEQEFIIWYDADYPDDTEDTLIKWKWIEQATRRKFEITSEPDYEGIGVDLAAMGRDLTVLTHIKRWGDKVKVEKIKAWGKKEMAESAGIVINYMELNNIKNAIVDDTGIGGLASLLREHNSNWKIRGINFGAGAKRSNCENMKAEMYMNLRELFMDGNIAIPHHQILMQQLNALRTEFTARGKLKINDGQSKSPDFADSLALACYKQPAAELGLASVPIW